VRDEDADSALVIGWHRYSYDDSKWRRDRKTRDLNSLFYASLWPQLLSFARIQGINNYKRNTKSSALWQISGPFLYKRLICMSLFVRWG